MKKTIFFLSFFVLGGSLFGQSAALSGTVVDQRTGEPLVGVKVVLQQSGKEALTDFDGNFTFSGLEPGSAVISVSYISYKETLLDYVVVAAGESGELKIKLIKEQHIAPRQSFMAGSGILPQRTQS